MTLPESINPEVFDGGDFEFNLTLSGDWVEDNYQMHEKFGVHEAVENLDREKLLKFIEFRLNFLQEELDEAKAALTDLNSLQTSELPEDARALQIKHAGADVVDAMIDLCVVAIGTLNALDVDAYEAWDRVHQANMAKEVGIKPSRPNPLGLPDLIKPAGWVGPEHEDNIGLIERL